MKRQNKVDKHNICVVGAGHVGLVAAACFAQLGNKVICVDNDVRRVAALKKLVMPFYEPQMEDLVAKNFKRGDLVFSSSLKDAILVSDIIFIAVGTPPLPDGSADLTSVENVARAVAENLNGYKLVVEKSTVPVQTGCKVKETILRYRKGTNEFDVASNPEFLREGKAVYDFFNPDRIVLGVESQRAEKILRRIYSTFKSPIVVADINAAELIKHASNSFLAMKISFANALSRVCDVAGADVKSVVEAIGMDKRFGPQFLQAGIGYGGFCFPKDVEAFIYISRKLGYGFGLLEEVKKVNDSQRFWFLDKVKERLWVLRGKRIAVAGLSFKPDTDDMRFAPSIDIVEGFLKEGAQVSVYDPQARKEAEDVFSIRARKSNISWAKNVYEASRDCDCLCFLTEWEEFRKLDFAKIKKGMRHPLIADGRNMFERGDLSAKGFDYIGMGR